MNSTLTVAVAVALLIYPAFLSTSIAAQRKTGTSIAKDLNDINQYFTKNLHQLIATEKREEDMVYSPISLETILALTYTGASGRTADELRTALGLPRNKTLVYHQFGHLMKSRRTENMELQMANKIYFKEGLKTKSSFRRRARRYFDAEVERVLFTDKKRTAKNINQWVAGKTNDKIRKLVSPNLLDEDTLAVLVNAIYFKAKWAKEFSSGDTRCKPFLKKACEYTPPNWMYYETCDLTHVEMMYQQDTFNYADLSDELGASVLQLPYADSDLSMLLILPNDIEGLAEVESRLRDIDLRKLPQRMQEVEVAVHVPKFRIDIELDMKKILQKLQITSLFKDTSGLAGIFGTGQPAVVSEVKHKAFIEVNEAGSEAAAATFMKASFRSGPLVSFIADHPFMFAIISPQAVYFVGHVVSIYMTCPEH